MIRCWTIHDVSLGIDVNVQNNMRMRFGPFFCNSEFYFFVEMPTGCGEQNMVHFVPDILILDYLQVSHATTIRILNEK